MKIIHIVDDFLFELFPKAKAAGNDIEVLKNEVTKYYTYGPFKPVVTLDNNTLSIELDTDIIKTQEPDYKKMVSLCDKGRYTEAKPILEKLIKSNPTLSEYHRIMGQILSDEGNQEEAINCLIDALRWDSRNGWALLMMGNIQFKQGDTDTAMKYFEQALKVNPDDHITLNNIGTQYFQLGNFGEAKKYYELAITKNPDYPNTNYALSMIYSKDGDFKKAFDYIIPALRNNPNNDILRQQSIKLAFSIASELVKDKTIEKTLKNYLHKLEFDGDKEIELVPDKSIKTSAAFELSDVHKRDKHWVRYQPNFPAIEHLIFHELVHLDLILQARKENINQLFTSTQSHKALFRKLLEPSLINFKKMGLSEDSLNGYIDSIFNGLNRQVYNVPIDLFIENFLYTAYPELRPFQFLSLDRIVQDGVVAMTDKTVLEHTPKTVLSVSKIYNLVVAIQLKDLYGIDKIRDFNPSQLEIKQAQKFYDEYLEYIEDKEPGEEYELVQHWAEDVKVDKYFELVDEVEYYKKSDITNFFENLISDDGDNKETPFKERQMGKFQKAQEESGTNMAVVMYMVSALEYFTKLSMSEVKRIAIDIAMVGTDGIRPDKQGYKVSSIPEKEFSGYQLLAYYYVSFKLSAPEVLPELKLPYDEEYIVAEKMFKGKNNLNE